MQVLFAGAARRMRGRKPLPTVLHEIHGNPSKLAPRVAEPKPVGNLVDAPAFLTESQQEEWRYIMRHCPPGVLKLVDRRILTAWVIAADLHQQAAEGQAKVGLLVKTPITGQPIQSPYLPILNKQALILAKLASELGFTPASRPRLFVAPAAGEGFDDGKTQSGSVDGEFEAWLSDNAAEATIN